MGQYGSNIGGPRTSDPSGAGSRDTGSLSNLYKEHESQVKMNWKNLANKSNAFKNINYQITFRVHKEVNYGETLCVLGSIPELGNWKEFKHHMKWTEGNVWESITPLNTHSYYFQYKYSLMEDKGTK